MKKAPVRDLKNKKRLKSTSKSRTHVSTIKTFEFRIGFLAFVQVFDKYYMLHGVTDVEFV